LITLRRPDFRSNEQALGIVRERDFSGVIVRLHTHLDAALQANQYLLTVLMRVAAAHSSFRYLIDNEGP
jgi:hypothetical protein